MSYSFYDISINCIFLDPILHEKEDEGSHFFTDHAFITSLHTHDFVLRTMEQLSEQPFSSATFSEVMQGLLNCYTVIQVASLIM